MEMSASYEFRDGYLYVDLQGDFDAVRAKRVVKEWINIIEAHNINRVLCDMTLVTHFNEYSSSLLTRYAVSEYIARSMSNNMRLAILEIPERMQFSRFAETFMLSRGVLVKITTDIREARRWLGIKEGFPVDNLPFSKILITGADFCV